MQRTFLSFSTATPGAAPGVVLTDDALAMLPAESTLAGIVGDCPLRSSANWTEQSRMPHLA
jgi:hypothetical protein